MGDVSCTRAVGSADVGSAVRRSWTDRFRDAPLRLPGVRAVESAHGSARTPTSATSRRCSTPSGIEQTRIVGCSMGGAIAIDFTLVDTVRIVSHRAGGRPGSAGSRTQRGRERLVGGADATPSKRRSRPVTSGASEDLRLAVWAPMGTDDAAGRRIREIAFDNIHELTMDESVDRGTRTSGRPAARRDRRADAGAGRRARPARSCDAATS